MNLSLSLSHTHTRTHTLSLSHTHTHSLSLSHTHTSLSFALPLSLHYNFSFSLSLKSQNLSLYITTSRYLYLSFFLLKSILSLMRHQWLRCFFNRGKPVSITFSQFSKKSSEHFCLSSHFLGMQNPTGSISLKICLKKCWSYFFKQLKKISQAFSSRLTNLIYSGFFESLKKVIWSLLKRHWNCFIGNHLKNNYLKKCW